VAFVVYVMHVLLKHRSIRQIATDQFNLLITKAFKFEPRLLHFFYILSFAQLDSRIEQLHAGSAHDFFYFLREYVLPLLGI